MTENPFIQKLSGIVKGNMANEQFGVNELSASVNMSRSTLHRKLHALTGQSISQFIRECRLREAMDLLKNEEITSSEAGFRVGFSSASYFSKSFNDLYGFPPGEARNHNVATPAVQQRKPDKKLIWPIVIVVSVAITAALIYYVRVSDVKPEPLVITDKSIVVLPFRNLSSDEDNQYFADGMMDAIRNNLSKIGELRVTSRTSSEKYRDNPQKSVLEIASELNVTYVLEGSALKFGSEIQINAQLIEAKTDRNVWSEEYSGSFDDVLSLQGEIAQQIANALQTVLSVSEKRQLESIPTKNSEAYNNYLLAQYQFFKWSGDDIRKAIPYYQKAIEIDPNFNDAYLGLAYSYIIGGLVWGIFPEDSASTQAKYYLNKSLNIDPGNAQTLDYLGNTYFWYDWDFKKAREMYDASKEKQGYYLSDAMDFFIKMGELDEVEAGCEYLIELDPLVSNYYIFLAQAQLYKGNREKGLKTFNKALELFDDIFIMREAAKNFHQIGNDNRSEQVLNTYLKSFPDRPPIIYYLQAAHAHRKGEDPAPFLENLKTNYADKTSGSPAWFLAIYFAEIGDSDTLFEWLNKSFDRHEVEMTWLKMEPALAAFKSDDRYKVLAQKMGFE